MRPLLLAFAIILALPAAAFAVCPSVPDESGTGNLQNQTTLMLCQQAELSDSTAEKSRELRFEADLQAQQQQFDEQLKLQQTFAAAQAAGTPTTFPPQQF